jgi:tetratricopeptide (TPR) repeat protein
MPNISFLQMLAHSDDSESSAVLAQAHRRLAKIARERGTMEQARIHIERALTLDEARGDQAGMIADYEFLGVLLLTLGLLDDAEHAIRKVFDLDPHLNQGITAATACANLGLILKRRGNLRCAQKLFLRSLRLAQRLEREDIVSTQYANLASLYWKLGKFNRAGILLQSAAHTFRKLRMEESLAAATYLLQVLKARDKS